MIKSLSAFLLLGALSLVLPRAATAGVIMNTLPVSDGLSLALSNTQALGVGFTMNATYDLTSVVMAMRSSNANSSGIHVSIYSNGSGQPGTQIQELTGPGSFSTGPQNNYTYTPGSALTLNSGQTYWLVVRKTDFFAFSVSSDLVPPTPTGSGATWVNTMFANPSWATFTYNVGAGNVTAMPGFTLNGTTADAVPEPASVGLVGLGLAGAVAIARRRSTPRR